MMDLRRTNDDVVTRAVEMLRQLGGEVVGRCPIASCEACQTVLDVAA